MIRPDELRAIREGDVDLAFRRWDRPRVKVGTRMRTAVGLVEVTEVERVTLASLTAEQARRAGRPSVAVLREALADAPDRPRRPVFRIGLRYAGPDPRTALREQVPDDDERDALRAWLDRLDAAAAAGRPWTRETLAIIHRSPAVRAPDLAAELGRETADFKIDVRKLKEKGLTESLSIGYRLSRRGAAVLGVEPPPPDAAPSLPRIGAPAQRALAAEGVTTLDQVTAWSRERLLALRGVGPFAVRTLEEALAGRGLALSDPPRTLDP